MSQAALPAAFGRYRPVAVIGSGAVGTVYKAHDPLIDRFVAVKMMRTDMLEDDLRAEYLDRFRVEAQAAGRCSHHAIVAIHDAGESEGRPYLVMELAEGETLQAILADPARRRSTDCLAVLLDVLEALDYAHARHITHRDIKPANVIVSPSGRAKVTDFGIARIDLGSMTRSGDMLGTPNYMAPEQVTGGAVDHRADLFAAAAMLHAILTGRAPFAGRNVSDTLLRLTDPAPADLSAVEAGPHAAFAPVLRRGLAKAPEARFGSAREFSAALRAARAGDRTLVQAAPSQAAPSQAGPVHAGPPQAALDPVLIRGAEADLTRHVGPMARVLAGQAARQAATPEEFLELLARHIPNREDAARFRRAHGGAPRAGETRGTAMTTGQAIATAAARGISAEALEAAQAILASHAGPIARVLVSRALREASSLDALVDRLVAEVKPRDQASFRRRLLAALADKR